MNLSYIRCVEDQSFRNVAYQSERFYSSLIESEKYKCSTFQVEKCFWVLFLFWKLKSNDKKAN